MNKQIIIKRNFGFTIVEILVVIMIIGLLAATVVLLMANANNKSRDSRRVEDVSTIEKAIKLYHVEYFKYPGEGDIDGNRYNGCVGQMGNRAIHIDQIMEEYANSIPIDPRDDGTCNDDDAYYYYYDGDKRCYQAAGIRLTTIHVQNMETDNYLDTTSCPDAGDEGEADDAEYIRAMDENSI